MQLQVFKCEHELHLLLCSEVVCTSCYFLFSHYFQYFQGIYPRDHRLKGKSRTLLYIFPSKIPFNLFVNNWYSAEDGSVFEKYRVWPGIGNRICIAVRILFHPRRTEFLIQLPALSCFPLRSNTTSSEYNHDMNQVFNSLEHLICRLCHGSKVNMEYNLFGRISWLLESFSNEVYQVAIDNSTNTNLCFYVIIPGLFFSFSSLSRSKPNHALLMSIIVLYFHLKLRCM